MRILVVSGASGGHIFPAVALIEALKEKDPEGRALLVLPERRVALQLPGIDVEYLGMPALRARPVSALLRSLWHFCRGSVRGLRLLIDFKPDVVVGFGTLPSVPVLFFAWLMRRKTMVHEQNVVPGKANELLSRFVDKVAVSFEESRAKFPRRRTVVTGNPLRRAIRRVPREEAAGELGLDPKVFTVLVTGGSQGSASINRAFCDGLRGLARDRAVQAIHITGIKAQPSDYGERQGAVRRFEFLDRMELAYSCSDAVICRAGATTCAELMFYSLPALVVPYPFAHAHQARNAAALERLGCVTVCADGRLDGDAVKAFLERCLDDRGYLGKMGGSYPKHGGETPASLLATTCMKLLR